MTSQYSPIIGAQLDVARQKEPVAFVKTFIDLLARHGYNALYFYVEMSIRVPVVDFQPEDESYSPEEIREIVAYGREKGILVIPALELAGHADKLLAQPNFAHLREANDELCLSHPGTLQLIETFLEQALPLFDSPVVHFGYDELFHLATCPRCRERLAHGETRPGLFLKHLQWLVELVQRRFPCRMVIWDDMFEYFPELLPLLPKQLELMDWEYDAAVDNKHGKFGNRVLRDSLGQYQANGLKVHIAPRELRWQNLATYFDYARKYETAGMCVTAWCHRDDFMHAYLPLIAAAPLAWQGMSSQECAEYLTKTILATPTPAQIHALNSFYALPRIPDAPFANAKSGGFLRRPNQLTDTFDTQLVLLEDILTTLSGTGRSELANDILDDMLLHVKFRQLLQETATWMSRLLLRQATPEGADVLKAHWETYGQLRLEQWSRLRPGIPHAKLDALLSDATAAINAALQRASTMQSRLELRMVLPDWHGVQRIELAVRENATDEFQVIYQGLPKPGDDGERPFFTMDIPLDRPTIRDLRIRSTGHNGLGVVYARVIGDGKPDLLPTEVTQVSGEIADPQNLLADNTTWCMIGDRDGVANFFRTELHSIVHEVVVHFSFADVPPVPRVSLGTALPSLESVAQELGVTLLQDTPKGWNAGLLREPFPDFLTAKVAEARWQWIGGTVTPELCHDFEQVELIARKNLVLRLWGSYFLQHVIVHGADAHTGTPDKLLGNLGGLFQLMVAMGAIPYLPDRLTATWMRGMSDSYRAGHDGRLGIWARSCGWIHKEVSGEVVRLGRLEYEVLKTPLDFIPMEELPGVQEGDPVIAIHIPGGYPMDPKEVDNSLELMKKHFADLRPRYGVCHSWLLNPLFAEKMPKSNFAHFQRLGKLLEQNPSEEFPWFVFGKEKAEEIDWQTMQPASRLQQAIRDEYLAGRKVLAWGMVVDLESFEKP
ncbi:MAG: family 20 glycosylhydrolase [Victivallales bacterium]|nr:family 20 glycosylhydrolase [Victivallales bacterium]